MRNKIRIINTGEYNVFPTNTVTIPRYLVTVFATVGLLHCIFFPTFVHTTIPDIFGVWTFKTVMVFLHLVLTFMLLYKYESCFLVMCFTTFIEIVIFNIFGWNIVKHLGTLNLFNFLTEVNLTVFMETTVRYFLAVFIGMYSLLFALTSQVLGDVTMHISVTIGFLPIITCWFLKHIWKIFFFTFWRIFVHLIITWLTLSLFVTSLEMLLLWSDWVGILLKKVICSSQLVEIFLQYIDSAVKSSTYVGEFKINFFNFSPLVWTRAVFYVIFGFIHLSFYKVFKNIMIDSGRYKPFFHWVMDKWIDPTYKKPLFRKNVRMFKKDPFLKKKYMQRKRKFFF